MISVDTLVQHIMANQFATGLGATALLGGLMYQLKSLPKIVKDWVVYGTTIQLTLNSKDDSFSWLDRWLAAQPYAKRTRNVTLRTVSDSNGIGEENRAQWIMTPGEGNHWFFWRRRIVHVYREGAKKKAKIDGAAAPSGRNAQEETLTFRIFGRHQDVVRDLVAEAKELQSANNLVMVKLWVNGWWKTVRGKTPRVLDSIILKDGQIERIVEDIDRFHKAGEWYRHRGIPYRRGYLFTGRPGTGKTSIVFAIAGHFRRPIYVINLGSVEDDNALFDAISDAPSDAIILLEDIDCAKASKSRDEGAEGKDDEKENESSKVTKAGLLNALDGITTPDGRIFIMTTNYVERLDEALIRPGRADIHEEFEYLDQRGQERMAERFYGKGRFKAFSFLKLSPALMQAAFSQYPDDPVAAKQFLNDVGNLNS